MVDKGFIIYPTYKIEEDQPYIHIFGRLENGESFLSIHSYRPFFYIRTEDMKKAEKVLKLDYEKTKMKNFEGEEVTRVYTTLPKDVSKVKKAFNDEGITSYEADVRFPQRFLMEKDLRGTISIKGKWTKGERVDRVYQEPEIKPADQDVKLKILSFDIETDKNSGKLYSISLYGEKIKTCLILKKGKFKNAETFTNEKELLERFKELIIKEDPDIITGWNVIDFDLAMLRDKFKDNNIKFDIGRTDWPCKLRIEESFYSDSKADCPGRMVLDGMHLLRVSFIRLTDYKLNTAAKEILGDEKLFTGTDRHEDIDDSYKNDPQKLIDYNIKDSKLVYDILEKTKVVELAIERSRLTRMPLDRVDSSIASLDSLYLKELSERKIVAPTAFIADEDERIKGGYVKESKPGIYNNIIVLDFKSLYPSIILTFNIDPYSFEGTELKNYTKEKYVKAPNGAYFRNEEGVLPHIIEKLWKARDNAKKRKDKLASQAIKIIMNSFFGVLANPVCRFYNRDIANAITHFGQKIIQLSAKKVEELGYEVIYGDTDSIFVDIKSTSYKEAQNKGKELEKNINTFFDAHIKTEYSRNSRMEIEFEKVYKKFLMPRVRHGDAGAKKRYAGILMEGKEEKLDFVGLEFVRRDWTDIAKDFQLGLLDRVFHEKPVEQFVQDFVKELKEGKHDEKLVYRKSIRKDVSEYVKTTPPHIKAARKAGITGPGVIAYYITKNGPEIAEKRKSPIDYEHYIEKQLKPIADAVLCFYDTSFEELMKGTKQKSLFNF